MRANSWFDKLFQESLKKEIESKRQVSSSEQSAEEEVVLAEYIVHCKQEDSTPIETFSRHLKTINSRDQLVDVVLNGNSVEAFEKRITSEQVLARSKRARKL